MKLNRKPLKVFNDNLAKLEKYKAKHGSCNVIASIDKDLSVWTEGLKAMQKVLPKRQARELEEIGFEFLSEKDGWESMLQELYAFVKKYRHCYINTQEPEYENLYHWTELQKQSKRFLKEDQIKRLESIGFDWEPLDKFDVIWNFRYEELRAFKDRFGHCLVPEHWEENPTLAHFVYHQRKTRIKRKNRKVISPARKRLLDEIGFVWEVDNDTKTRKSWDENYKELLEFKDKFGHINVPQDYNGSSALNIWLGSQRRSERGEKLSSYRKEKLEYVGYFFKEEFEKQKDDKWEQRFSELEAFKAKFGHFNVPYSVDKWNEYENLHHWVKKQKEKPKTLTKEREKKLLGIGFKFSEPGIEEILSLWDQMVEELLDFKKNHGHPNIPYKYDQNPDLKNWVNKIRKHKRLLPEVKIKELEELGFDFKGYVHWKNNTLWNKQHAKLKLFYQKFGHCNVPETNEEFRELYFWVTNQRRGRKKLSEEQIKLLTELGFEWKRKKRFSKENKQFKPLIKNLH